MSILEKNGKPIAVALTTVSAIAAGVSVCAAAQDQQQPAEPVEGIAVKPQTYAEVSGGYYIDEGSAPAESVESRGSLEEALAVLEALEAEGSAQTVTESAPAAEAEQEVSEAARQISLGMNQTAQTAPSAEIRTLEAGQSALSLSPAQFKTTPAASKTSAPEIPAQTPEADLPAADQKAEEQLKEETLKAEVSEAQSASGQNAEQPAESETDQKDFEEMPQEMQEETSSEESSGQPESFQEEGSAPSEQNQNGSGQMAEEPEAVRPEEAVADDRIPETNVEEAVLTPVGEEALPNPIAEEAAKPDANEEQNAQPEAPQEDSGQMNVPMEPAEVPGVPEPLEVPGMPEPSYSDSLNDASWSDPAVVQTPVNPYAELNARIADEALKLVGVTDGMQCTEVVQQAMANAGVVDAQSLWPRMYADTYGYVTDNPEPGNLIYYNQGGDGLDHIAVYIGNNEAVHGNYDTGDGTSRTVVASAQVIGCDDYNFIQVER